MEEISAILGIDMTTATPEQVAKRAYEVCLEQADCYEADTEEYAVFMALSVAIQMVRGGK